MRNDLMREELYLFFVPSSTQIWEKRLHAECGRERRRREEEREQVKGSSHVLARVERREREGTVSEVKREEVERTASTTRSPLCLADV